jgi:ribosomal protein S18 acetylase RimI-like enzyme
MLSTRLTVRTGTDNDAPAIAELVNRAYAGEGGGWTNERSLVAGPRTAEEQIRELMKRGTFLLGYEGTAEMVASVFVEPRAPDALYIGLLSVEPAMQNRALGRRMLAACEEFAQERNVSRLALTVLAPRSELRRWYERQGFQSTGERIPLTSAEGLDLLGYEKVVGTL